MIIDKLSDLRRYIPSLPALETVCSILESGVLKDQSFGSYTTDNPSVRYNLFTYHTEKTESDIYEIHQKEVDVQILLSGFERMDIASKDGLQTVQEYDRAKEAMFSKGR
ncbi:MAG TPA: YhcH/YjgK/YiaL family protein, partial [Sphaerochaeta sp.]|nr:YhcH/YjgK/YiaL family protein [Sphaerochaeta sp.]